MNPAPLSGLTILVTRPRAQADNLVRAIAAAGGVAVLFPLLDIAPVADPGILREQLSRLAQFDLAIFISPNAVQYGMAALAAQHGTLPPQVAVIGRSSAQALRDLGMAEVLVPTQRSDSEGLLSLPQLAEVAGKRVMILRGDGGREWLGDTLKTRGATVEYATCYRRSKTRQSPDAMLRERPDVITVTSSEALAHLREMLGSHSAMLSTPLFVPHARIAELARQQGWTKVVLTADGDDGLLASLLAWRNTRGTT